MIGRSVLRSELPPSDCCWTAASLVLLSSQLGRIIVDAYGKTPMAHLTTVRAKRLARLFRETDLPIERAMREVGWHSRGQAAQLFRQAVGVTPARYRQVSRERPRAAG